MLAAVGVPVGEVDALAPALAAEEMEELVGVLEVALALLRAHVEPDAERGTRRGVLDAMEDAAVIPPEGGGEEGEAAEGVGVLEAEMERDEGAERGAAEASVLGLGAGAVGAIEEGLELLAQHAAVAGAVAAAVLRVGGGGVLGEAAQAGVGDADQDEGLDAALGDEAVGGAVGLPGATGNEGDAFIEEILAVVQIEHGEALVGMGLVLAREVDEEGAVGGVGGLGGAGVGQEGGVEAVDLQPRDGRPCVTQKAGLAPQRRLDRRGMVGDGRWFAGDRRSSSGRGSRRRLGDTAARGLEIVRWRCQAGNSTPISAGWG